MTHCLLVLTALLKNQIKPRGNKYIFQGKKHKFTTKMGMSTSTNIVKDTIDTTSFFDEVYAMNPRNLFSVYCTGGASSVISSMVTVPGCSNSLIQAVVPYSLSSLQKTCIDGGVKLEDLPRSYCSMEMANSMADASYRKTIELILAENKDITVLVKDNIFGVSCTAALVSKTLKKGKHRVHVAVTNSVSTRMYYMELEKGLRSRLQEDLLSSYLVMKAISDSLHSPVAFDIDSLLLSSGNRLYSCENIPHNDIFDKIYAGKIGSVLCIPSNAQHSFTNSYKYLEDIKLPKGTYLYPGSFNPLHEGHVDLVVSAMKKNGWIPIEGTDAKNPLIVFEISAINVDKPPLSKDEIQRRLSQFSNNELLNKAGITNYAVVITSQPLFLGKSKLFNDCTFIIGADTMTRLIDPKYYNYNDNVNLSNDEEREKAAFNLISALTSITERGCSFVVGGRTDKNGEFCTLQSIFQSSKIGRILPSKVTNMFAPLLENEFRVDISSTQIRSERN